MFNNFYYTIDLFIKWFIKKDYKIFIKQGYRCNKMFWFITNEDSKVYNMRFIDTTKTSFFNIAWLHSLSLKWYVLTLYIILSSWSLFKLLTIIWFPTVQWKLYNSTHCGLNKLVGTWNIHHCAMRDLKSHYATLLLILRRGFWSLHNLVLLRP